MTERRPGDPSRGSAPENMRDTNKDTTVERGEGKTPEDATETKATTAPERVKPESKLDDSPEAVDAASEHAKEIAELGEVPEIQEMEEVKDLHPKDPSDDVSYLKAGAGVVGGATWGSLKFGGKAAVVTLDSAGWGLDWLGKKALAWAAEINKGKPFPIIGNILEKHIPKAVDRLQEATGFKKRLHTHMKENKAERKKVMDKLLKEMKKEEKKWEKEVTAAAKKAKREEKWKKRFGDELGKDMALWADELEKEEKGGDSSTETESKSEPAKSAA